MSKQIREPGFTESGCMSIFSKIGGTDARDRQKLIVEARARLGFEQIEEMKRQAQAMELLPV